MKSVEDRRNNPEIRNAIEHILNQKREALLAAEKLLEEALNILRAVPYYDVDDALYVRTVNAASRALTELYGTKNFIVERPTETYIGNLAAFELGAVVEKEL